MEASAVGSTSRKWRVKDIGKFGSVVITFFFYRGISYRTRVPYTGEFSLAVAPRLLS